MRTRDGKALATIARSVRRDGNRADQRTRRPTPTPPPIKRYFDAASSEHSKGTRPELDLVRKSFRSRRKSMQDALYATVVAWLRDTLKTCPSQIDA